MSKDFSQFCQDLGLHGLTSVNQLSLDLGIHPIFSSGYHHSANQAENVVRTVKDLMKCCYCASVHCRLALLEY